MFRCGYVRLNHKCCQLKLDVQMSLCEMSSVKVGCSDVTMSDYL